MWHPHSRRAAAVVASVFALVASSCADKPAVAGPPETTTPVRHVVVIFGENVSFDHYFGTYPSAANTSGVT